MASYTESPEKAQAFSAATAEINEVNEALEGYVLDPSRYPNGAADLKTTDDGQFVLIPQPLDTSDDPLNWSPRKKALILTIIAYIASLADYTGGTAILTIIPQSVYVFRGLPMVRTLSANANMEGMAHDSTPRPACHRGKYLHHRVDLEFSSTAHWDMFADLVRACGLFFVALASYLGRLPVTLVFQAIFVGTCAWSAAATAFDSYLAARIINGFFCSVGQGGALIWIKDLFYYHEHPRAINYVEFAIILSPYLGPLITAFIVSQTTWRWAFWLCTILAGISLILVMFLDETLFDRNIPSSKRGPRGSRIQRLLGIEQAKSLKQRSLLQSFMRPIVAVTKIPVLLTITYYFLNFAWVIGVNTTVSIWLTQFYGFGPRGIGTCTPPLIRTYQISITNFPQGFFYFFGIAGPLIGWALGHYLHDYVGRVYALRHHGHIDPEARLIVAYPATLLLFISLLVIGFALEHLWHYMVLALFSGLQCVGVMIVTTAVNAYLLDAYPEGSGEVGAWVTASRNWSGFMATYIQIEWVTAAGPAVAFGIQAGITAGSILLIVFLQVYGKRLRRMQGRMMFGRGK